MALEITHGFEKEGARVTMAQTLTDALLGVEDPALAAAILDHGLGDGDSHKVCERMKERSIPFVTYSGYDDLGGTISRSLGRSAEPNHSALIAHHRPPRSTHPGTADR